MAQIREEIIKKSIIYVIHKVAFLVPYLNTYLKVFLRKFRDKIANNRGSTLSKNFDQSWRWRLDPVGLIWAGLALSRLK